jgi:hypothetical protein
MPQKLALKRLTASDLTFFQWHFFNRNAGNQKAINLNADVFVEQLYPSLTEIIETQGNRLPLDLYLYGPGLAGELNLQRKIMKGETYKNWRLNGEFVHNPPEDPERFNLLRADDIAIFSFRGDLFPYAASVYLVAARVPEDAGLHRELMQLVALGRRSMIRLADQQLSSAIRRADVAEMHPVRNLLFQDALEDAAQNGIQGIRRLRQIVSRQRITQEALRQARENASRIGRRGEELVRGYLSQQKASGLITDFRWLADENAISPYDFEIITDSGKRFLEVKATEGSFDNPIHVSYNELLQMREATPYDLYRVYGVQETQAKLRIARDTRALSERVLTILEQMPDGVRSDSISVTPSVLNFDEPITIELAIEEE